MNSTLIKNNVNTLWAGTIAEVLARMGVRTAVISPGFRAMPLIVGFSENPCITAIPVLDERSASFFALGLARQTGKPTALICTSGTATAHFYAAVIEASLSNVPLLVITADRPLELQASHTRQTIDQLKLYGDYPRWFYQLPVPELSIDLFRTLRQRIVQAFETTLYPQPGPVHLNVPFREPQVPEPDAHAISWAQALDWNAFLEGVKPAWVVKPQLANTIEITRSISELLHKRGIIIVGPTDPTDDPESLAQAVGKMSRALGWPVLVDGISPLRNFKQHIPFLITHYDFVVRNELIKEQLTPEHVISIGFVPISKLFCKWLQMLDIPTWSLTPYGGNYDPLDCKTRSLPISVKSFADLLANAELLEVDTAYAQAWMQVEHRVEAKLEETFGNCEVLFEGKVARILSQVLPKRTPLWISSSMPLRDVEFFWKASDTGIVPYVNRGANGIDGIISSALGLAYENRPTVLLTGDLAFLHDINGLLIHSQFQGSLTIVIINNKGGGIFEYLPTAHYESLCEKHLKTPQEVDLQALVAAYGLTYHNPENWEDFTTLVSTLPQAGIRVIEVRTQSKHDVVFRKEILTRIALDQDIGMVFNPLQ